MKIKILALCFCSLFLISTNLFAQIPGERIKVNYLTPGPVANSPSYYLNGVSMGKTKYIMAPRHIISIDVKKNTQFGKIYITTKEEDNLTMLTPVQIKEKYATSAEKSVLYFVDGNLIDDINTKIEEDYILSINVVASANVNVLDGNAKISLIQIFTKSKENLTKAAEVRIRG
jgi:hypothetical protein